MSLIKRISLQDAEIGIWKIEETVDQLTRSIDLSEDDFVLLHNFTNDKRKREFLAIRHLLKKIVGNNQKITYNKLGQPLLCNSSQQISISHSTTLATIILSNKPVGIDVEELTRNVEKVSSRFLSSEELTWTNQTSNSHFTRLICWCAKEAIYKLAKKSDVDFSKHIRIKPFNFESEKDFSAAFIMDNYSINLKLNCMVTENNVVVWGVGEA